MVVIAMKTGRGFGINTYKIRTTSKLVGAKDCQLIAYSPRHEVYKELYFKLYVAFVHLQNCV
jgi:hypothetical protein